MPRFTLNSIMPAHKRLRIHATTMLLSAVFLLAFHGPGSLASAQQKMKIWSDDTGAYSVEAALVAVTSTGVTLKKRNGVVVQVPFERLSKIDRKFIWRVQAESNSRTAQTIPVSETRPLDAENLDRNQALATRKVPASRPSPSLAPDIETNPDFLDQVQRLPEPYREIALDVIGDHSLRTRLDSLSELTEKWPAKDLPALRKMAQILAKSSEGKIRQRAIELLGRYDGRSNLRLILAGTRDENYSVRMTSYAWIEKLKDPRAIGALVDQLKSRSSEHAVASLVVFGSAAEPKLLPLIRHESEDVQLTACSLLAKIGTGTSLTELETVAATTQSFRVRMQARNAIEQITERTTKPAG